jgi:hypothetical protein
MFRKPNGPGASRAAAVKCNTNQHPHRTHRVPEQEGSGTFAAQSLARALARDKKARRSTSGCWPGTKCFRIDASQGRILDRGPNGWSLWQSKGSAAIEFLAPEGSA